MQQDQAILVSGSFIAAGDHHTPGLARLLPDGRADANFRLDTNLVAHNITAMASQSDGRVLLAGFFVTAGGDTLGQIIRLTSSGRIDPAYISPQDSTYSPWRLHVGAGDTLTVGWRRGLFPFRGQDPIVYAGRYAVTGRAVSDFGRAGLFASTYASYEGYPTATDMAVGHDGSIWLSGLDLRSSTDDYEGRHLYRLTPEGVLDTTFRPALGDYDQPYLWEIAAQPATSSLATISATGDVVAIDSSGQQLFRYQTYASDQEFTLHYAGGDTLLAVATTGRLISLNGAGERINYSTSQPDYVRSSAIQAGRLISLSSYTYQNHPLPQGIFRADLRMGYDESFRGALYRVGNVAKVIPLSDGKLVVCGDFIRVGDSPQNHLVRLLPDSRVDASFTAPARSYLDPLFDAVELSDGRLLVAGLNREENGSYGPVELLNPNGRPLNRRVYWPVEDEFYTQAGVNRLAVDAQDRVYAASYTTFSINGLARRELLRYDFGVPGVRPDYRSLTDEVLMEGFVYSSLLLQDDGKLLLSGRTTAPQTSSPPLVRLTADGDYDETFQTDLPDTFAITALDQVDDGQIVVAGYHPHPSGRRDSADIRLYVLTPDGLRQEGLGGRLTGSNRFESSGSFFFTFYPGVYNLISIGSEALLLQGLFTTYRDGKVEAPLLLDATTTEALDNWLPRLRGNLNRSVSSPRGAVYLMGNFESDHGAISLIRLGQDAPSSTTKPSEAGSVLLHPNPVGAGQPLTLRLTGVDRQLPTEITYELHTLGGGARVQSGRIRLAAGKARLDLPHHLAAGAYLITLRDGDRQWMGRIIRF